MMMIFEIIMIMFDISGCDATWRPPWGVSHWQPHPLWAQPGGHHHRHHHRHHHCHRHCHHHRQHHIIVIAIASVIMIVLPQSQVMHLARRLCLKLGASEVPPKKGTTVIKWNHSFPWKYSRRTQRWLKLLDCATILATGPIVTSGKILSGVDFICMILMIISVMIMIKTWLSVWKVGQPRWC